MSESLKSRLYLLRFAFRGLVGVGGFIDSRHLVETGVKDGEMGIVFGPNGTGIRLPSQHLIIH